MHDTNDDRDAATAVEALYAADAAVRSLGIVVNKVAVGQVALALNPNATMGNGHGIVHGGYVFLLADTALAYAFASRGTSGVTVNASIDFLAPARVHTLLIANASETHHDRSTGIYEVIVTDDDGRTIATFHGHARAPRANPKR